MSGDKSKEVVNALFWAQDPENSTDKPDENRDLAVVRKDGGTSGSIDIELSLKSVMSRTSENDLGAKLQLSAPAVELPDMWSLDYIGLYSQYAAVGLLYGSSGTILPFCVYSYEGGSNVCANGKNIMFFAWNLKIFFAILTDMYHPYGLKRRPWMVFGWGGVLFCLLLLAAFAHMMPTSLWLVMLMFSQGFLMMSDVPADGYSVELGQLEPPESRGQILATGQRIRFTFCVVAGFIQTFLLNGKSTNASDCQLNFSGCWAWGLSINGYYALLFAIVFVLAIPVTWMKELSYHEQRHTRAEAEASAAAVHEAAEIAALTGTGAAPGLDTDGFAEEERGAVGAESPSIQPLNLKNPLHAVSAAANASPAPSPASDSGLMHGATSASPSSPPYTPTEYKEKYGKESHFQGVLRRLPTIWRGDGSGTAVPTHKDGVKIPGTLPFLGPPVHKFSEFKGKIWDTLQNLTTLYLLIFVVGVQGLTNFTSNVNIYLQYYIIELNNFQAGMDTVSTYLAVVGGIWLFQSYLINRNWHITQYASTAVAAILGLVWIAPYYNAGGTMNPYFTIFIDLDTNFAQGMSQVLYSLSVIEVAKAGQEATTYELIITVGNAALLLNGIISTQLLTPMKCAACFSDSCPSDTVDVNSVADYKASNGPARFTNYAILLSFTSLGACLLFTQFLPRSKEECHEWKKLGELKGTSKQRGYVALTIAVVTILYGLVAAFLLLDPQTSCEPAVGGEGC